MSYQIGAAGQTHFQRDIPEALAGMRHGTGEVQSLPFMNNADLTAPTYTITPPGTVDNSTDYSVSVNGLVKTVTTDASATTAELGLLIYNALTADPLIGRLATISLASATGVITLVSTIENEPLTIAQTNAGDTTNDLTIANTVAAGTGQNIPVGRAVGTLSSYTPDAHGYYPAKLIDHASNYTFKGFTELRVLERTTIGPDAEAAYLPNQVMSVMTDCGVSQGIWVECTESDIVPSDSCYIDISAGDEGKVTKTSTSNMDVSSIVKFTSEAKVANGKNIVRVYYRNA